MPMSGIMVRQNMSTTQIRTILNNDFHSSANLPKMENKALRITVGLTPEERDFLNLLQHEDAAANLSQAVAWCIDSCMKIEKLYGIDACYVAYNDIRKPENDPTLAAGHQHSPPSPAIEGEEEELPCICSQVGSYPGCTPGCTFPKCGLQPTPPAGAEGEGEIPFDVCTDIYNMWRHLNSNNDTKRNTPTGRD